MSLHVLKSFKNPLNIEEGDWIVEVTLRHSNTIAKIPLCSYVLKAPIGYCTQLDNLSMFVETIINKKESYD